MATRSDAQCVDTAHTPTSPHQGGDAAKLAAALIRLAELDAPPLRFAAGADAVGVFETRAKELQAQADAHRGLSSNLAHDDA
jgi:hypothetical protein